MAPSVMAVAAHCDDLELICGGTLLKYHRNSGYDVVYVLSTNNMSGGWAQALDGKRAETAPELPEWVSPVRSSESSSFFDGRGGRIRHNLVPWYYEMAQRKREAEKSASHFFGTHPIHLDYPQRHYTDRNLNKIELCYGAPRPDCVPENFPTILTAHEDSGAVARVAQLILEKNPELIITHSPVDYTEEHSSTCHLMRKAFLQAKKHGYDGSLIFASPPTSGSYGAFFDRWDTFIDITGFSGLKREAVGMHACQIPYPDRLDLEDVPRGKVCGVGEAETFYVYEISMVRQGELSGELRRNTLYCRTHFQQMFFQE